MKRTNIIRYTAALVLPIALLGGCTGDFEDLNTNPYEVNPSDLPFEAQFTTPMSYSYPCQQNLFQFWTNLQIDIYGGYFESPHGNFTNQRYAMNRGHCGGMHENFMQKIFNNTRRLIRQCEENNQPDFAAVMRVVEVYNLLNYTDTYGPVPYSSVIAADALPERPGSYAYDTQEQIYGTMISQLNTAIEGFATETPGLGSFDIWCNGDHALWLQVANQLKLRIALRMVKVAPALAEQYAAEAIRGGVLTDTDILISKGFENEMWLMFNWGDCGANASLVTMLKGYDDPRLPLYFTKNTQPIVRSGATPIGTDDNGFAVYAEADYLTDPDTGAPLKQGTAYLGLPAGCPIGGKPNMYSNYSGWAGTFTMPQPILFAAEGWFLRAEAELRWQLTGESVQTLYETGIRTSIKNQYAYRAAYAEQGYAEFKQELPADWKTLASDETIDAYINNGTSLPLDYIDPATEGYDSVNENDLCVKWDDAATDEEKLQRIITQKWIALFPLSNEAWAEYRRTGYPKLFPVKQNENEKEISTKYGPRRLPYNENELNSNTEAVNAAIGMLNAEATGGTSGDNAGTRLWWDQADKGNF